MRRAVAITQGWAMHACGCSAAAALGWGRVWASGGVGVIYIQPHTKIRKIDLLTTTMYTAVPTRNVCGEQA